MSGSTAVVGGESVQPGNANGEPSTKKLKTEKNGAHANEKNGNHTNGTHDKAVRNESSDDDSDDDEKHPVHAEVRFRDFFDPTNPAYEMVRSTYEEKNSKQCMAYCLAAKERFLKFNIKECSPWEAFQFTSTLDDKSDPDVVGMTQIIHAYQTAEALREFFPGEKFEWLHLTGLIHDMGKILKHAEFGGEPDWATVGDTYPVGCQFAEKIVHSKYFELNPDYNNPKYNTKYGIYEPNCGLMNVTYAWGHDEYMYECLLKNGHKLPLKALYMIRFHSFYAWHNDGEYTHLCNKQDMKMLKWVRKFSNCDLYSKADGEMKIKELEPYYKGLMEKFLPPVMKF
jgi:inositol oxygenase